MICDDLDIEDFPMVWGAPTPLCQSIESTFSFFFVASKFESAEKKTLCLQIDHIACLGRSERCLFSVTLSNQNSIRFKEKNTPSEEMNSSSNES